MEAHLHEESKLWSFVVLFQSQSRMQEGKKEKSNMKFKMTETFGYILSTSWSLFHAYYISFRSSRSQESNASNSVQIRAETKKLWPFEDNCIKLCENFAAAKWNPLAKFRKVFRSCETTSKHTCATSQVETPSSQLRTTLRNHLQAANQVANHLQVAKSQIQLAKSKFKLAKWTIQLAKSTCVISDICYQLS